MSLSAACMNSYSSAGHARPSKTDNSRVSYLKSRRTGYVQSSMGSSWLILLSILISIRRR